jgi:hypothetical protein
MRYINGKGDGLRRMATKQQEMAEEPPILVGVVLSDYARLEVQVAET